MTEDQLLELAREAIRQSPSYPKLAKAYRSFIKNLYTWPDQIAARTGEIDSEPERLLSAHAGVMNRKSARAKTMERLASDIFQETGLPRRAPGKFRGDDRLNVDRLEEWANARSEKRTNEQ